MWRGTQHDDKHLASTPCQEEAADARAMFEESRKFRCIDREERGRETTYGREEKGTAKSPVRDQGVTGIKREWKRLHFELRA